MSYQLCDQCQRLELSVDMFKIGGGSSCSPSSSQSLRPSNGSPFFATLKTIEARASECSLCKIIAAAIPPEVRSEVKARNTTCHLVWELDGRDSLDPSSRKRTRRLRIRWSQERLKAYEAYLVLAAPASYDESNLDYPLLLNEETQFLGRRIGPVVNKRNLIREFLRLCENNHDERCTGKLGIEDPFAETLKQSYFGVIDIQNQNLVPLPYTNNKDYLSFQPYATVSYVWGNIRDHRTTLSNIQDRLKSGGLAATIDALPVALKQSIELIENLGIRYIWIDSLCIIQDSSHSWNLNSRTMHLIYGNSTLTICAADGASAEVGLRAIDKNHSVEQNIGQVAPDVHLVLHQSPESNIEDSVWNRRAWTFQERLLSRRCLIFTKGQVYFQCRSTGMSEDIFVDKTGQGWSLDLTGAPLQTLTQLRQRALWFYANCVSLYTKRELYEPFDILAAFNGMCKLIEGTLRSPFTFGLPTSHFDFALLWQPVGKSSLLEKPISKDEKYQNMKFPSWSWCGWKSEGVLYNRQMIEGCLSDVRTWLRDHTWIDWHIRDGYGTPQRIWDNAWAKEDRSTEERWRGYRGNDNSNEIWASAKQKSRSRTNRALLNRIPTSRPPPEFLRPAYDHHRYYENRRDRELRAMEGMLPRPPAIDPFGRPLEESARANVKNPTKPTFALTLPEYPFHVPAAESKCRTGDHREFPDLPILQFFTWSNKLRIAIKETDATSDLKKEKLTNGSPSPTGAQSISSQGPLSQCYILDRRGDRCGSIMVDSEWLAKGPLPRQCRFIAISEAKSFTTEEMPEWTYYIPKERVESEWDIYFVLLIEYHAQEGLWRRVALGKVFKTAFTHDEDTWREILLG
ncbi:heterokaryon incompatibility protein (HET) domain-containing protein [Trichoderma breve]|uniref:Heterokaryon incompatibility protein (HET) domain-containing protein n=1 Tax=Trichoderma breve TaxID=2034170 RepID=A0A9W9E451_9HYPO|nr:heterokaryon incompatibility protein (HET) domain-containing protein [Trichoderma breve]KAJ4856595.1 heterokaryon incompatibility protein (HET) domain-containing protein [Trichoderma breve]